MTISVVNNLHKLVPRELGDDFLWGVAMAAVQNEGEWNVEGKGLSIWDAFSRRQGKIKGGGRPAIACDFYHRYKDDLLLAKALGFSVFRFSISWPRLLPEGFDTRCHPVSLGPAACAGKRGRLDQFPDRKVVCHVRDTLRRRIWRQGEGLDRTERAVRFYQPGLYARTPRPYRYHLLLFGGAALYEFA